MGRVISERTEKVSEKRALQGQLFFTYFARSRNTHNSQNLGKVNSYSAAKIWGNTNITELCVS